MVKPAPEADRDRFDTDDFREQLAAGVPIADERGHVVFRAFVNTPQGAEFHRYELISDCTGNLHLLEDNTKISLPDLRPLRDRQRKSS